MTLLFWKIKSAQIFINDLENEIDSMRFLVSNLKQCLFVIESLMYFCKTKSTYKMRFALHKLVYPKDILIIPSCRKTLDEACN